MMIQIERTWYAQAMPIEIHTPADPMCQEPIDFCHVAYIPRVGDLLWRPRANYKVLQVAQFGEDTDSKRKGYEFTYTGRICVMVEVHSFPESRR